MKNKRKGSEPYLINVATLDGLWKAIQNSLYTLPT